MNRPIYTNPTFSASYEKVYLRAQIARIMHSTTLVPKGIYKIDDPVEAPREIGLSEPEEGQENVILPSTKDMGKGDNWCHFQPNILKWGATAHGEIAEPEGEDAEGFDPEEAKKF